MINLCSFPRRRRSPRLQLLLQRLIDLPRSLHHRLEVHRGGALLHGHDEHAPGQPPPGPARAVQGHKAAALALDAHRLLQRTFAQSAAELFDEEADQVFLVLADLAAYVLGEYDLGLFERHERVLIAHLLVVVVAASCVVHRGWARGRGVLVVVYRGLDVHHVDVVVHAVAGSFLAELRLRREWDRERRGGRRVRCEQLVEVLLRHRRLLILPSFVVVVVPEIFVVVVVVREVLGRHAERLGVAVASRLLHHRARSLDVHDRRSRGNNIHRGFSDRRGWLGGRRQRGIAVIYQVIVLVLVQDRAHPRVQVRHDPPPTRVAGVTVVESADDTQDLKESFSSQTTSERVRVRVIRLFSGLLHKSRVARV